MGDVVSGTAWLRSYVPGAKHQPTYSLRCLLGSNPPKVIEGYANWNQIERPKRKSLTEWRGTKPLKVELSLIIDHFDDNDGNACEHEMRQLELMAGASQEGQDESHPPLVLWDANAQHDDREAGHLRWVIETLAWENLMWNREGPNIIRAECTVTLMEFVEDEFITEGGAQKHRKRTKGNKHKTTTSHRASTYQVTLADTQKQGLKTIAAKRLGSAKKWRVIGNAQHPPIRDPMNIHENQILKIPKS